MLGRIEARIAQDTIILWSLRHCLNLTERPGKRAVQVRRHETSKLNGPEIKKQSQLQLRNMLSCLSLEDEDHGNRYEDEGEEAHDNEVEKKWTKIRQSYRLEMC